MKKVFLLIGIYFIFAGWICNAQKVEMIPFGDMDHWTTRVLKESALLGGHTRYIYEIAPTMTIEGNKPYRRHAVLPELSKPVRACFPKSEETGIVLVLKYEKRLVK